MTTHPAMTPEARADIRHRFTNHPPRSPAVADGLDRVTGVFVSMGDVLVDELPASREKSLAITKLEECSMWAKAALARHQPPAARLPPASTPACVDTLADLGGHEEPR